MVECSVLHLYLYQSQMFRGIVKGILILLKLLRILFDRLRDRVFELLHLLRTGIGHLLLGRILHRILPCVQSLLCSFGLLRRQGVRQRIHKRRIDQRLVTDSQIILYCHADKYTLVFPVRQLPLLHQPFCNLNGLYVALA